MIEHRRGQPAETRIHKTIFPALRTYASLLDPEQREQAQQDIALLRRIPAVRTAPSPEKAKQVILDIASGPNVSFNVLETLRRLYATINNAGVFFSYQSERSMQPKMTRRRIFNKENAGLAMAVGTAAASVTVFYLDER